MGVVLQTLAALAELLIPHYVSASIFAIANKLPINTFHSNVKLLAVSCPCTPLYICLPLLCCTVHMPLAQRSHLTLTVHVLRLVFQYRMLCGSQSSNSRWSARLHDTLSDILSAVLYQHIPVKQCSAISLFAPTHVKQDCHLLHARQANELFERKVESTFKHMHISILTVCNQV